MASHDPNMAVKPADRDGLAFHQPDEAPFRLSGFAWYESERLLRRLRRRPARPVSAAVEDLCWHAAGGQCAWRGDSGRVVVRARVAYDAMDHFAQTGNAGFDLYAGEPGLQRFAGVSRFAPGSTDYEATLFTSDRRMREFTLNFPLYARIESLYIGLEAGSRIESPSPWRSQRPVVVYGTSIVQGGCASRPGMAHTNILSRALNRPVLNFGFSGSAKGEAALAEELALIADPALYILDYEANVESPQAMRSTLPEFIAILRRAHPETPILVMSRCAFACDSIGLPLGAMPPEPAIGRVMREVAGEAGVPFLDGRELFGTDRCDECTVDGVHPTDLGFFRMAEALRPVVRSLVSDRD